MIKTCLHDKLGYAGASEPPIDTCNQLTQIIPILHVCRDKRKEPVLPISTAIKTRGTCAQDKERRKWEGKEANGKDERERGKSCGWLVLAVVGGVWFAVSLNGA